MADYVRTERVTKHIRYELPAPTNLVELDKATAAAISSWRDQYGTDARMWDDSITVTVQDDLVVISWEVR